MDISYYKKYEPIAGKWYLKKELGRGAYGTVFEAETADYGMRSALKIVSIPANPSEIDSYREEHFGVDDKSVSSYFYGFVEEYLKEIRIMSNLKGKSNIVSIEDYDVKEHTDNIGWDILIRMELLTSLNKWFAGKSISENDIIRLGIDICKALEECEKQNIIHRDIKPSNIFVSDSGEFKLGDFGVARTLEKTSSAYSKKGTYTYMAPEVYRGEDYSSNVDVYSLGIVMYKLLNNNFEPFRTKLDASNEEQALIARMKNNPIPSPANASEDISMIILKACSYFPEDRYVSPEQMRKALESLNNRQTDLHSNEPVTEQNNSKQNMPFGGIKEEQTDDMLENISREEKTVGVFDNKYAEVQTAAAFNGIKAEVQHQQAVSGPEQENNIKTKMSFLKEKALPLSIIILCILNINLSCFSDIYIIKKFNFALAFWTHIPVCGYESLTDIQWMLFDGIRMTLMMAANFVTIICSCVFIANRIRQKKYMLIMYISMTVAFLIFLSHIVGVGELTIPLFGNSELSSLVSKEEMYAIVIVNCLLAGLMVFSIITSKKNIYPNLY